MGPIERQLIDYISAELIVDDNVQLNRDDELLLEGIIDSIGATRLVAFVEDNWSLRIPPQDVTIDNFGTVNQVAEYVRMREAVGN